MELATMTFPHPPQTMNRDGLKKNPGQVEKKTHWNEKVNQIRHFWDRNGKQFKGI